MSELHSTGKLREKHGALLGLIKAKPGELAHIDFVRFIAAMGIVAAHSVELMLPRDFREASHKLTEGFTLFVDVFFVLSGFVISYMYATRMNSVGDFLRYLQRRLARLVPLHWATLLAATLLYAALAMAHVPLNTRPDLSPACLAAATALIHSWVDCGGNPPNGASWSISAEMVMYCAFPLIILTVRLPLLARLMVLAIILVLCAWLSKGVEAMSLAWTPLRAAPAFFLGTLIYSERHRLAFRIPSWTPLAGCLLLVVGSLLVVPRPILLAVAYASAALAIIADQNTAPNPLVQRLSPLGQLTYSIYMLHGLIIMILANAIGDKLLKLPTPAMIATTFFTWIVVILVSACSFAYFEQPARIAIGRLGIRPAQRSPATPV